MALLLSTAALAQPAAPDGEPSAADKETARSLVATGHEHLEAGQLHEALEAFQGADDIMKLPTTGMLVAETLVKLGRLLEARELLLRVERFPRQADEPEAFTRDRDKAIELGADVAERIPSLQVALSGLPPDRDAQVWVDGEELKGTAAHMPRKVDPGPHEVIVRVDGKQVAQETVTIVERENRVVTIPIDASLLPQDDSEQGVSPLVWVGFGVAAGGLLIGTINGAVALASASEAKDYCQPDGTCTPEAQEPLDRTTVTANVSTVSFIIGGLGAGLGLFALFVLDGDDADGSSQAPVAMRPLVGPGWLGAAGTF